MGDLGGHRLWVSLPQAGCGPTGSSPSVLLMGAAPEKVSPEAKLWFEREKPDGFANVHFVFVFLKHSGLGSVFRLVLGILLHEDAGDGSESGSDQQADWTRLKGLGSHQSKPSPCGLVILRELCHPWGLSPTFTECHGPESMVRSSLAALIGDVSAVLGF